MLKRKFWNIEKWLKNEIIYDLICQKKTIERGIKGRCKGCDPQSKRPNENDPAASTAKRGRLGDLESGRLQTKERSEHLIRGERTSHKVAELLNVCSTVFSSFFTLVVIIEMTCNKKYPSVSFPSSFFNQRFHYKRHLTKKINDWDIIKVKAGISSICLSLCFFPDMFIF
jgi:hypothetical protein